MSSVNAPHRSESSALGVLLAWTAALALLVVGYWVAVAGPGVSLISSAVFGGGALLAAGWAVFLLRAGR